jgi:hypothetical protein
MSDTAYNEGPAMMAARGQTYGKRKEQEDAQRAVPMRRSPVEVQGSQPPRPVPAAPGSLTAPSARPDEPITAGAPFGEGPGPEMMPMPIAPATGEVGDLVERVRSIASRFPNPALLGLLAELES